MSVYKPFEPGLFASASMARTRHILFQAIRFYDVIAALLLAAIMALLVLPALQYSMLLLIWPAVPALGAVALAVAQTSDTLSLREVLESKSMDGARRLVNTIILVKANGAHHPNLRAILRMLQPRIISAIAMTLFLVAFMVNARVAYAALHLSPLEEGAIWLLYVFPIQQTARTGSIRALAFVCGMTVVGDFLAHTLFNAPLLNDSTRIIVLKAFWLLLICLVPTLLTIYLSDRQASVRTVSRLLENINSAMAQASPLLANDIASLIARELGYTYVNIFLPAKSPVTFQGGVRMVGASSDGGRKLVSNEFFLPAGKGIINWAATHRETCVVNDVARDSLKRYVENSDLPDTQSEVAIPMMINSDVIGVLDVQATESFAFTVDDVNLLESIASHVALAINGSQNLVRAKGLYTVSKGVASNLVSHGDLPSRLQEIADIARDVTQADSVVIYWYNPLERTMSGPTVAGIDIASVAPAHIVENRQNSMVHKVLRYDGLTVIDYTGSPEEQARDFGSFPSRQGIQTTVAIPLKIGREAAVLGVIFVNFATPRTISKDVQDWCQALAEIATLALEQADLMKAIAEKERRNIWMELHDGMNQYSSFSRMLLDVVVMKCETGGAFGAEEANKVALARQLLQRLQQHLNYLGGIAGFEASGTSLIAEMREYVGIVERAFNIQCPLNVSGNDEHIPTTIAHDVLLLTREAIHNALRHGNSSVIKVAMSIAASALEITIDDNGQGFSTSPEDEYRGIRHMRHRAEKWNGVFDLQSRTDAPSGTTVYAAIPLEFVGSRSTSSEQSSE